MSFLIENPFERKVTFHLEDNTKVEIPELQIRFLMTYLYSDIFKYKAVKFFNYTFGVKKTYKFWRKRFEENGCKKAFKK
tara:strand:- start:193 stop:429 length:237 start_codon:yes stop_codon:yes gene_type:complete